MTIWTPALESTDLPIYRRLADAIETDIRRGALSPGQRLPTHRDLAESLGVTVGTVTRGYAEASRRGLVRGEVGRGMIVAFPQEQAPRLVFQDEPADAVIDMGLVTPLYGLDPDLSAALRTLAGLTKTQDLLRYQQAGGNPQHRQAGARWIQRHGLEADPKQVLVTAGGQHALTVVLAGLFRPGEAIGAEALCYPGLTSLTSMLGIKPVPIALDDQGLVPQALEAACARESLRGLYLMPNCQNPTTACLPEARREQIAVVARRHNLLIIEDESYGLTAQVPGTPLAALAPERTFFIAGFSKSVAGGLRIGFLQAPRAHVDRLAQGIATTTWMASPLCAQIAAMWINDGTAEAVCAQKRAEAHARNVLARGILADHRLAGHDCGYFCWLSLPEPWRSVQFQREAHRRGVELLGAETFVVGQAAAPMAVRLSLSAARDREQLAAGLRILALMMADRPGPKAVVF